MEKLKHYMIYTLLLSAGVSLTACSEDDDPAEVQPDLEIHTVEDFNTNPRDHEGHFVFYSLAEGKEVAVADSASAKWDIAFSKTSIILNGGASGPSGVTGQVVDGIFEELAEAPESGYQEDAEGVPGISKEWYRYTAMEEPQHAILPVAGKILVIKTEDGQYAKMEIISYYEGNPDTSTEEFADYVNRVPSAYYTFRYVYQPDGSRDLQ